MNRKWINAFAVAAVVALGGTAVAQQQGSSGMQQQQPQQSSQQMQQGQTGVQGQQGIQGQIKSVRLTSLDQTQLKQVQTHLKDLGFYKGTVDGNLGQATKSALLSYFQSQVSLAQQGRISDASLSGFGFDRAEIERVRGIDQGQGNVRENTQGRDLNQQQQMQQPQQQQQPQQPMQPQQQQQQPQQRQY